MNTIDNKFTHEDTDFVDCRNRGLKLTRFSTDTGRRAVPLRQLSFLLSAVRYSLRRVAVTHYERKIRHFQICHFHSLPTGDDHL